MEQTTFKKEEFTYHGGYLNYQGKFVARFKYGSKASFLSFLVKNFYVGEYFDMLENKDMAPLRILETKGYVQPNVKKMLVKMGYEPTLAGMNQYLTDSTNRRMGVK